MCNEEDPGGHNDIVRRVQDCGGGFNWIRFQWCCSAKQNQERAMLMGCINWPIHWEQQQQLKGRLVLLLLPEPPHNGAPLLQWHCGAQHNSVAASEHNKR